MFASVVHPEGLEPSTSCSEDRRSIQLSYGCVFIALVVKRTSFAHPVELRMLVIRTDMLRMRV